MLISLLTEVKDNLILSAVASLKKSFFGFFLELMIVSQDVRRNIQGSLRSSPGFSNLVKSIN